MKPFAGALGELVESARAARSRAYAPYSRYRVGAAVMARGGRIYVGCNVENASYGATLCAERSAVAAMVAGGDRSLLACAVVTSGPRPGAPCGICRQVLAEFGQAVRVVLVAEGSDGRVSVRQSLRLADLLPHAFRLRGARRL